MKMVNVLRFAVRLVILAVAVLLLLGSIWHVELYDWCERRRLIHLGNDLQELEDSGASLEDFQRVLANRWRPAVVSMREGELTWDMEVLRYRGRRQGHFYIVFDAKSGKLIEIQQWP